MLEEHFTEYLTGWQICQLPLSSEGSKLFSFRGASPPTPCPGALPLDPAGGSAPDPHYNPLTANLLASPLKIICPDVRCHVCVPLPGGP